MVHLHFRIVSNFYDRIFTNKWNRSFISANLIAANFLIFSELNISCTRDCFARNKISAKIELTQNKVALSLEANFINLFQFAGYFENND